ncbi:MAG: amidase [Pseudonocardia sp.]
MTGVAEQVAGLDATAQAALVAAGEVSAVELTEGAIERIERLNPLLGAVVTPLYDRALAAAASTRSNSGPFAGVPFLLKDLVAEIEGTPFAEGSAYVHGTVSTFTSELVRRLERAGLVILGRTASPEFGMLPACEPVLHGPTRNPWDPDRSTSGSSGGSAAAVASGMVPMAHGNDVGGSLRFPASACGLFGLKPTRARVPLGPEYGDAVGGWAVEHALTVSVRDSAALLDATAGAMPGDPYPAPPHPRPFAAEVGADPGRLRIAWTARTPGGGTGHPDCVAALADAVALLTGLGHELVEADLPGIDGVGRAIGTVFDAATAWIVGYWTRRLGRPPGPGDLEPVTRAYLDAGRRVGAADYLLAVEELQRFARGVAGFLSGSRSACGSDFDGWLTPTMSEPPPRIGEMTSTPDDPLRPVRRGGRTVAYPAVVANITGNPAMSVPLWWNRDGLPVGVHVLGRYGDETTLLRLAAQLESARPWAWRLPAVSGCGAPAPR